MKIAFYSPLKSPHHPVPSGDRLMARLLIEALRRKGHRVDVVSELRAFLREPVGDDFGALREAAAHEVERIASGWADEGPADVWFCYHPYYKAPDLIGPALARRFALPYVTAEASYSNRRNRGHWQVSQAGLREALSHAAVNICMTERDRRGIAETVPDARCALLRPFIDPAPFRLRDPAPEAGRLAAVAMMRPGDKMDSYAMLGRALSRVTHPSWRLSIAGDGPLQGEVEACFAGLPAARIEWLGECSSEAVAGLLARSALYVWPGCGEAYGLAYLEAAAAGVPAVAQAIAGVPEVVRDGVTGLLTPPGDIAAYAAAIDRLLGDDGLRQSMAASARRVAAEDHSIEAAASRLDTILHDSREHPWRD
ncbi:Glycosyltransferase KanE [Hartmannibacter diazotrophicus]|uniref:Glycosyltransferase KanE n=1 Tax=Hartmannibacter diazotrophicus TaxID=1482074 RepID=A0A2C9DAP0_9HYPH|nr:glycosyltransferase family 4 protein [Hartmannibacter diazotrophicus]SON57392.1 Glycosyltransferase KanE [Hartmannibacter diazotrophicus]